MISVPHIETINSAVWIPWAVLLLTLLLGLTEWTHQGYIGSCLRSIFAAPERRYEDSPKILTRFFSVVFCVGTFALSMCTAYYTEGRFSLAPFLLTAIATLVVVGVRSLLVGVTAWVFSFSGDLSAIRIHTWALWVITSIFLLAGVLLVVHVPSLTGNRWLFGTLLAVYWVVVLWKIFRGYMRNVLSILYILIYFVTLEVLPVGGLLWMAQKIVTNI
ncbi:MAG: DUF4271 domain-containing protein [Paludibacteraceae bacterium]|nr:DUF4271 domain-containing protein [Paludibacteraceae bacterium]